MSCLKSKQSQCQKSSCCCFLSNKFNFIKGIICELRHKDGSSISIIGEIKEANKIRWNLDELMFGSLNMCTFKAFVLMPPRKPTSLYKYWLDDFALKLRICHVMPSVLKKKPNFLTWNHIMLRNFIWLRFFSLSLSNIINCFFAVIWWNRKEEKTIDVMCFVRVLLWLHQFGQYLRMVFSCLVFCRRFKPKTKTDFFFLSKWKENAEVRPGVVCSSSPCRHKHMHLFVVTIYDVKYIIFFMDLNAY